MVAPTEQHLLDLYYGRVPGPHLSNRDMAIALHALTSTAQSLGSGNKK